MPDLTPEQLDLVEKAAIAAQSKDSSTWTKTKAERVNAHIEASNPAAVLSLIAEVRRLRVERDTACDALAAGLPDDHQQRRNLCWLAGRASPRDAEQRGRDAELAPRRQAPGERREVMAMKAQREPLAQLLLVGDQMSNLCYNLAQQDAQTARNRQVMRELVHKWDRARGAVKAAAAAAKNPKKARKR